MNPRPAVVRARPVAGQRWSRSRRSTSCSATRSRLPNARRAAAGGATELVIASIVFYAAVDYFEGNSSDSSRAIIWSAAGIVVGSVFAVAGHWFAHRPEWRSGTLALVSGVLFGEGIHLTQFVDNTDLRPAGIIELVAASALILVCLVSSPRSTARHPKLAVGFLALAAATATLIAVQLIDAILVAATRQRCVDGR